MQSSNVMWLEQATVVVEPVVEVSTGQVLAYQARPASRARPTAQPQDLVLTAMSAGRLRTLIAILRLQVAAVARRLRPGQHVLMPLCDVELGDPALTDRRGPLHRARERVALEVSAATMAPDLLTCLSWLTELEQTGFTLALSHHDGSSAAQLLVRELMPQMVLLAPWFARCVATDAAARRSLAATLDQLAEVGSRVIATGVGDPTARDALAELGCDLMTGPLFATPMPAAAWVG